MLLRDDLYNPIPGENPTGQDIRYSPIYERIKEARRQDEDLDQGAWKRERKLADYGVAAKLAQEAIAMQSKDLQLAAWLTEALLHNEGFAGLEQGLTCCRELIGRFGLQMFPACDEDDLEPLSAPLDWLGSCLEVPVKMVALNSSRHNCFQFTESRLLGYEDKSADPNQKKAREKAIKDGKLAPEEFDKSFEATPKAFYVAQENSLRASIERIQQLDEVSNAVFGNQAPSFGRLLSALEQVLHVVHQLLEKKRQTEPDPEPVVPAAPLAAKPTNKPAQAAAPISLDFATEPVHRRAAIENIAAAAAYLRKTEPGNPAPYLMLRGFRWGELRAAGALEDPALLEAPPTEVRRRIKQLALERCWQELIETAETYMAFPYSRAWFDLQRFVVQACSALGAQFDSIAKAICSELRALLADLPALLTSTLMDDTPAANAETQAWLRELAAEPQVRLNEISAVNSGVVDGFRKKFADPFALAVAAMKSGDHQKTFEIMCEEIAHQRSGRGRFFRRLQLVELCISAKREAIAQPILEELIAAVDAHKIEDWEEHETVAGALSAIMSASKRIQSDAKEKQKYFERICRLDPVKALAAGN
ncbi:MAG TPA: type VI secretion system protein TssA [Bryobacteraceae bacterium]|nr:type VI secretion system protein TssA [Bryobacteraceae bacterium]